ncbi:Myosin-4 [Toxocara canis]|uniref:Myosin-4 n=1 Tax=Toxocara canis TaxID=6265 RepID=A0A0B2VDE1_TOXCA|nr:Myosin-4 [Toxocara canis]
MAFEMECEKDPGWQYLRQTREQMAADQSKPYDSKKNCWVPDAEEGFIAAEITSTKGDMVTVVTAKGNEQTLKKDLTQEMNPPKFEKTEDMSNLTFLNDASVLHNLRARYSCMLIYTYSGLFCVVINPYKRLPIYTDTVAEMFMGKRRTEMPPHLFAVSDEAYRNMLQFHENQSMLITGESGAGKTENTKKVIAYFAVVGASQGKGTGEKKVTLEDQIIQTNPVLEAFGNAKTVRNNNSSRFGKFIRIHFSRAGKVASCDIEHYLLEKSRVIRQAPGERCYHIFYQLYSDYIPTLKKDLLLDAPLKDYWFVAQAELTIEGVNDKEEHQLTDEAFDILNFSAEEKMNCYRLVSAIMHMGNMKFKQRPREEQAEPDGTDEAEKSANMFGVDSEEFLKSLTKPRVKVGTEWVNKGQNVDQVTWAVGAMAKGIYARLFHWLVKKCNLTLDQKGIPRDYFIGVLDIAGFEIFDFNSFEQLWINFVNEKLQQFFNHHMFVLEQEEYEREGIQWTFIDFGLDLQACIELIEKPMGIISMLDEECIVPKATDMTLAQKLIDNHLGKHPNFEKPKPPKGKQSEAHFAMKHYAGTVRYNVTNWLEKNKDPLNDTFVACLKASKGNALLNDCWQDYTTQEEAAVQAKEGGGGKKKGKSGSFMTVSMMYRESLNNLMSMLNKTHPHFIRCIIPNEKKKSGLLDAALVLNQLTCNGVLEGIRICRKGFPNRSLHEDFKHRYAMLASKEAKSDPDPKKCAEAILSRLVNDGAITEEHFRVGKTKVFFKAGIVAHLEDLRDQKLGEILAGFQAQIRWFVMMLDRHRRAKQRAGYVILQRNVRAWSILRTWDWYLLYGKIKPMLKGGKEQEEMDKMNDQIKQLEAKIAEEEKARKGLEESSTKLLEEKNAVFGELEEAKGKLSDAEDRLNRLNTLRNDIDKQINELNDRLGDQEDRNADLMRAKKKVETDAENLRKTIEELEGRLQKAETDKQAKDQQIRTLQDEMQLQDENIAKLNKEKKHQEEINRKLMEDLQSEEDKGNHTNKLKGKLEQSLDDLEDSLEREKRARNDIEKQKRKVEGELKVAQENIDEINRQRHEIESNLKKKEAESQAVATRLEEEQDLVNKLKKQLKETQGRIGEVEEELENERQSRAKADRVKSDLQRELEELGDRLDEQGGATAAQVELNKKREAELAKLRRDLEEANMNHENQLAAIRKKHNDAVAELGDQIEQAQKQKAKVEKDKAQAQRDAEDLANQIETETAARVNSEKLAKQYEMQIAELQTKCDEQNRQLQEFTSLKSRMTGDNADLNRQIEEAESQLNALTRLKGQLTSQLEEARQSLDEEARERNTLAAQAKNYQHEIDQIRESMEEEIEAKSEILKQLSHANAEIQQWQTKFESEGLLKADELDEAKKRQLQKINELQEALDAANSKITSLEKTKSRLVSDLDDAQVDVERANAYANQLEKKQKGFDKVLDEWRKKTDDLAAELDNAQREARNVSTELMKLKTEQDEILETIEGLRRENKSLTQEIKDLTDQLSEGGRSVFEMQKIIRRLEVEKDELQHALDEAEAALEAEESKVLRAQVEVSQIRSEIEKRIQEKEEEFENTRKNHQRAIESMQASLENETKGKADLLRLKKKLESDINELEIALDHANLANADAQKNLKKYQDQIRELQQQVEIEQRSREDIREQYLNMEKRATVLQSEKEELVVAMDQAERARKQAERDANEAHVQCNELAAQAESLNSIKRKLDGELLQIQTDLDETLNEYRSSEERSKAAMADAARLAEQLHQEQENAMQSERMRKSLETQLKEMQARLDEAEAAALKGGKKVIAKLETRIRELESELDGEQRRYQETNKTLSKHDRRIRELQFQVDEDKKNAERTHDLIDKLQNKLKAQKKQIEEAEELANLNLQKFRQIQHQLDDAEERADHAENSLSKMRAKSRSGTTAPPGVQQSQSAAVLRSSSRSAF